MSNGAGPPQSKTASLRGYCSLHRPPIVAPGAYDVELPSIDAEFSVVARSTGWRSAASSPQHRCLAQAAERLHDFLRPLTKRKD
jgi:hypothetical protein